MISVSIVTVTQSSRIPFLRLTAECIRRQNYPIFEWVIIDTTGDLEEEILSYKLPTVYHKSNKTTIGAWRNEYNSLVKGEIIVVFDDDEYYPPNRVSHAVKKLSDKKFLIAGCDKIFIYDIHFKKLYRFTGFNKPGHWNITNNTMAYWKDYLLTHKYDETRTCSEEESFTNNYNEPAAELDPTKTLIQFSHAENTFDKKIIIYQNLIRPQQFKYIIEQNTTIRQLIPSDLYKQYKEVLSPISRECEYDIVYYCGYASILWSPMDESLGGSEQAVKYLSSSWAKQGKKVIVYGNLMWEGMLNGVEYSHYLKFRFWDKFKTLILWRLFGIIPFLEMNLNAENIIVDLHDNSPETYQLLTKYPNIKIALKSQFHKLMLEGITNKKFNNAVVIPNGLKDFTLENPPERNPYRLCYTSDYSRGLDRILKYMWPKIKELEPRAELHVYYGMGNHPDTFKKQMTILLNQPGVFEYGRQPTSEIIKEKYTSTFNLYYTSSLAEIDCIAVRESLLAGCIPILASVNLFQYRTGIHLTWLDESKENDEKIADAIVKLINSNTDEMRSQLKNDASLVDWDTTSKKWLSELNIDEQTTK